MQCSIQGCPGDYEARKIIHTVRHRDQTVVIEEVPAEVCSVCGDTLLSPEAVRGIEQLLASHDKPVRTVPVFDFSAESTKWETA